MIKPPRLTLYISGPISGIEDGNRAAFKAAEDKMYAMGYDVVNPRRNKLPAFFDLDKDMADLWSFQMRKAVKQLTECDAAVFLPEFQASKGARIEYWLADLCGIPRYDLELQPLTVKILEVVLPDFE